MLNGGLQYQSLFVSLQKLQNIFPLSKAFLLFSVILIKVWDAEHGTNLVVLGTEGKTRVMKEKLNISSNCFQI